MFAYEHKPYAQYADGGQPLFFRQSYGGNPQPPSKQVIHGIPVTVMSMEPVEAIYIYGHSFASAYEEDRAQEDHAWNLRRSFLAMCYSVMCPRGESGMIQLDLVEAISQDDFEAAAAQRWQS